MRERRSADDLLAEARAGLDRVSASHLAAEMTDGALVVDIRPVEQRQRDGDVPGAIVIDRNVLEWRLDPASPHCVEAIDGYDQRIVLVCNEGYSSSLAAATLRKLGLHRATDLDGGVQAMLAARHWDAVHGNKAAAETSWFQAEPSTSQRLLTDYAPPPASVVDVGAGTSFLADRLLEQGWADVTVLDVSAAALSRLESRCGTAVTLVLADLLSWVPTRTFDAWHDRATFHFLTDNGARQRYAGAAARCVAVGGVLVIGTFAPDGPGHCSGLRTARYDADALAELFGPAFALEHTEREEHTTPWGDVQPFTWAVLRRR